MPLLFLGYFWTFIVSIFCHKLDNEQTQSLVRPLHGFVFHSSPPFSVCIDHKPRLNAQSRPHIECVWDRPLPTIPVSFGVRPLAEATALEFSLI